MAIIRHALDKSGCGFRATRDHPGGPARHKNRHAVESASGDAVSLESRRVIRLLRFGGRVYPWNRHRLSLPEKVSRESLLLSSFTHIAIFVNMGVRVNCYWSQSVAPALINPRFTVAVPTFATTYEQRRFFMPLRIAPVGVDKDIGIYGDHSPPLINQHTDFRPGD